MTGRLFCCLAVFLSTITTVDSTFAESDSVTNLLQSKRGSLPLRNSASHDTNGVWLDEPKIVGGLFAKPGDDPWQVGLVRAAGQAKAPRPFCGGSLVSASWIVTAAHCVDNGTLPSDFDVLAGTTDVDVGGVRVDVAKIFIHPEYIPGDVPRNDIALIMLKTPVSGPQTGPIGLLQPAAEPIALADSAAARVTGWGAVGEGGGAVRDLRYVNLMIFTNKDCNDPVAYNQVVKDEMVCAGFAKEHRDSCQGDSGGPLTVAVQGGRRLAGVVSWGDGCARPDRYGVYTRVARYTDWIAACEKDQSTCGPSSLANADEANARVRSNRLKNRRIVK